MDKRPCGPFNQNAFVVADMEAALDYWTRTMQVGPFFRFPKIEYVEADYRGTKVAMDYKAALAFSGDLMIELIQPISPSIFKEFLDAGRSGVQHFAAFADDFTAACADLERRGGKRVQGGSFADGSCLAYYDMGGPEPSIIEIVHLKPEILDLFSAIKAASVAWDGKTQTVEF